MQLDQIVSSGMIYFALSFLAGLVYYVVVFVGMLVSGVIRVNDLPSLAQALPVVTTAFLLLLALDLVRGRVKKALDRRFYKEKTKLDRTLQRMGQAIEQLVDPPTLAQRLLHASAELLGAPRGAVYLRQGEPALFRLAGNLGPAPPLTELSSLVWDPGHYIDTLAAAIRLPAFGAALLGLALNYAAYESEIYRAALEAVSTGQLEAARTLGLTERQVLTLVRAPQAFRLALAPMTNDFVALLKDSSLVSVLTVLELTKQTQIFATNLGSWVLPGTLCAALYLLMSLPLAALARRLERRWKTPST